MIKNLVIATSLVVMTTLGGCAGLMPSNLTTQVAAVEAEVQSDANLVCGFIPTVATIAAFIPGASTVAPAAASIAEAICAAVAAAPPVTTLSARLRSVNSGVAVNVATVRVPGVGMVPIAGQFTR